MSECTCNSTHGSADCPFHGWAKAPKESTVLIQTEYRKCGCVYERSGDVLIRRRYCAEHPAEIQNTLSTSPSKAPLREQIGRVLNQFGASIEGTQFKKKIMHLDYEKGINDLKAIAQSHADSQTKEALERVKKEVESIDDDPQDLKPDAIKDFIDQELKRIKERKEG